MGRWGFVEYDEALVLMWFSGFLMVGLGLLLMVSVDLSEAQDIRPPSSRDMSENVYSNPRDRVNLRTSYPIVLPQSSGDPWTWASRGQRVLPDGITVSDLILSPFLSNSCVLGTFNQRQATRYYVPMQRIGNIEGATAGTEAGITTPRSRDRAYVYGVGSAIFNLNDPDGLATEKTVYFFDKDFSTGCRVYVYSTEVTQ